METREKVQLLNKKIKGRVAEKRKENEQRKKEKVAEKKREKVSYFLRTAGFEKLELLSMHSSIRAADNLRRGILQVSLALGSYLPCVSSPPLLPLLQEQLL